MSDDAPMAGRAARSEVRDLKDAPLLDDLLPWSVAPLRLGRDWVLAPDAPSLRARWARLTAADGEEERAALFRTSRARTLHSAVSPLPGQTARGVRLAREAGACPEPVRVLHGPWDPQWLIPDQRLIDAARPELWRVADARQTFLVESAHDPRQPGGYLAFSALLPDGHSPAGRPGRIRPLYRRPGAREPNLAPGLLTLLRRRLGLTVTPEDVLAWIAAAARPGPEGREVPLTADPGLWRRGVALGRRVLWLHTRGARGGAEPGAESGTGLGSGLGLDDGTDAGAVGGTAAGTEAAESTGTAGAAGGAGAPDAAAPRLPGGQRPYVRAPLPANPAADALSYDQEERALHIGEGRVAPVDRSAWDFEAGGAGVVGAWFAQRARPSAEAAAAPGTLAALRPRDWPQEWTSELLELLTVLTLLSRLRPAQRELAELLSPGREGSEGRGAGRDTGQGAGEGAQSGEAARTESRRRLGCEELRRAGVLPPPSGSRRPASVLDLREEGPDGQLALL